jgi:hypothetical protein
MACTTTPSCLLHNNFWHPKSLEVNKLENRRWSQSPAPRLLGVPVRVGRLAEPSPWSWDRGGYTSIGRWASGPQESSLPARLSAGIAGNNVLHWLTVLVSLGTITNSTDWVAWTQKVLLTTLRLEVNLRSRCQYGWILERVFFLVCRWLPVCSIHTWQRKQGGLSWVSFTPSWGLHPHKVTHPSKAHPYTITLEIRVSTHELGEE